MLLAQGTRGGVLASTEQRSRAAGTPCPPPGGRDTGKLPEWVGSSWSHCRVSASHTGDLSQHTAACSPESGSSGRPRPREDRQLLSPVLFLPHLQRHRCTLTQMCTHTQMHTGHTCVHAFTHKAYAHFHPLTLIHTYLHPHRNAHSLTHCHFALAHTGSPYLTDPQTC